MAIDLNKWKGYWYTFDPDMAFKVEGENEEDFRAIEIFSGEILYDDIEKFSDIVTSEDWKSDFKKIPQEVVKNPKEHVEQKLMYEDKQEITRFYIKLVKEGEPQYI